MLFINIAIGATASFLQEVPEELRDHKKITTEPMEIPQDRIEQIPEYLNKAPLQQPLKRLTEEVVSLSRR
ncbi:MAG: hypothetical protein ACKVHM_00360 [Pseudomonadales bacterium]|jgi:hypothetical protein|tara:strand:- start:210 stop:419 length:210 start_codon:yes stop_codon:yes gene_type:complete